MTKAEYKFYKHKSNYIYQKRLKVRYYGFAMDTVFSFCFLPFGTKQVHACLKASVSSIWNALPPDLLETFFLLISCHDCLPHLSSQLKRHPLRKAFPNHSNQVRPWCTPSPNLFPQHILPSSCNYCNLRITDIYLSAHSHLSPPSPTRM